MDGAANRAAHSGFAAVPNGNYCVSGFPSLTENRRIPLPARLPSKVPIFSLKCRLDFAFL